MSTAPPTTVAGVDIVVDPIEIKLSFYSVLNYNPPAAVNANLNNELRFNPIDISLSVEGYMLDTNITVSPIDIVVGIAGASLYLGNVIIPGPIDLALTIKNTYVLIEQTKCNFIKWSKIGSLDFTIDESNIAGERPLDWKGCVWHVRKLGDVVVAYGENGVSMLKPSGVHWGMDTVYRIGLKNKGAFAGTDSMHFFVDKLGQLFKVDGKFSKLDYSEFISEMGVVILTLDIEKNLLYICDGSTGYIYGIDSGSFGRGPGNVTGLAVQGGNLYVVSAGEIVTPRFEICTDIYDLGTRKPKTIAALEIGSNLTEFLYASVDYRNSYKDEFKQIGWFLFNPAGKAFPKCYGHEFRFRIRSTIYEYFEVDYIKVRGHIHGFSWTDTQKLEGYTGTQTG